MEYFHIEVFFGSGLSSSDYSDYIVVGIDKTITEIKDQFNSIILLIFLIKNNSINHKLFDISKCEYWELTKEFIDELSNNKKLNQIKIQELPPFTYAIHEDDVISLGIVQCIPELVFLSLKDMFSVNFTITRDNDGYSYN